MPSSSHTNHAAHDEHYKLTYFDLRAIAEPARLTLHYAGVAFDDERISWEQWPALKPSERVFRIENLSLSSQAADAAIELTQKRDH